MNLKTFAQESRNRLMDGVSKKLLFWGFDKKGRVVDEPQKISGGYLLRGEPYDDVSVPHLWEALRKAVLTKGIEVVVEEAAYTWFNRIMAIKILAKNGYDEPQLDYVEGMVHTPIMVHRARQGKYSFLDNKEQERLKKIIVDYSKDREAFALLLTGYCHNHNTLKRVFGRIDDYTELLLPDNMLQDGGFLHLLNTTDAISDEEYKKVELIGWLYQFYISERKDEVFASFGKGKKAEAKDIPAATQIFTPNWIVKYMVENTAGKIWLDKNPDSPLRDSMKYLVTNDSDAKNEEDAEQSRSSLISTVEELTLIDPASGSGHILVEGFDLLYQMYLEEYYTPEEAVESILKNNLFGLDIDDRSAQLATFAILLKAAKPYPDIWRKEWLPQVYAMPEAHAFTKQELKDFLGDEGEAHTEQLLDALELMQQAKNLGSVMKVKLTEKARSFIAARFAELKNTEFRAFGVETVFQSIQRFIPVLLLLTKKYTAVVANPPYMGQKNMNADLKNYVNGHYPRSKSDLFAIFIERMIDMLQDGARVGCITMESWMFLSSYEKLRIHLLNNYSIASLAHFGWHIIGIAFGTATLILEKSKKLTNGEYSYLSIDDVDRKMNVPFVFPKKDNGRYARIPQTNFSKIPGSPIAYWVSERGFSTFEESIILNTVGNPRQGMATSDVSRFIRYWHEISLSKMRCNIGSRQEAKASGGKWFPHNKGGGIRKWYGNNSYVVNWEEDGKEVLGLARKLYGSPTRTIKNLNFYFKPSVTWGMIGAGNLTVRASNKGFTFDVGGPSAFPQTEELISIITAYLNSTVAFYFIKAINPTLNFNSGDIGRLPIKDQVHQNKTTRETIIEKSVACIEYSNIDWDSRETSWDFENSPLLNDSLSLSQAYQTWQEQVSDDFFQLHTNEEELNRIFIDIYGLQEELTPEVPLKDITILQDELDRKVLERLEPIFREKGKEAIELPIKKDVVISQFISYAIGLFMGRYRLDKPGLNIAHPNPSAEELANYFYNGREVVIDEDAILPLMGSNCTFPDDALHQFYGILDTIWGQETRTENINFIQECLDKDLEKFLVKDFYKYHCGMYKKKPIYWLFSSKKGAFQVLVYMHRMNEFTAEKIRANYLLEHIKHLRTEESILAANESSLSTQEARKLEQIRTDIHECEEYDMELKNVADQQIKIDLDDGVDHNYALFSSVVAKIK